MLKRLKTLADHPMILVMQTTLVSLSWSLPFVVATIVAAATLVVQGRKLSADLKAAGK